MTDQRKSCLIELIIFIVYYFVINIFFIHVKTLRLGTVQVVILERLKLQTIANYTILIEILYYRRRYSRTTIIKIVIIVFFFFLLTDYNARLPYSVDILAPFSVPSPPRLADLDCSVLNPNFHRL